MALAFFLPVTSLYWGALVLSPIGVSASAARAFVEIAPTYAGAGLLVVAIALAARPRAAAAVASAAVAITIASGVYVLAASSPTARLILEHLPLGVAAFALARAWRRAFGARRLALLIDAYALASFPLVALNFEVARCVGAWLFIGAWGVLAGIRVARALA